ncbi:orotidine 5'-phosphate decarboxylase [Fructobacillus pseudoficulneus]|uniref:Orotidine 5'-phosphate decarboxylase n=1 Tax=Fructobacillus pseudoficulneus TaxID=220714 RepID=A0A3F3H3U8_9LACO|nr:orotidine-5'-phosphate decarboxylase [Fructobacillus pseudoficulneus]GAP03068.1 orotidine 5'-phosphate decarboxylase [Fructobacillus pseudoficulneus]SEH41641.1 orotidine-5'-phosphate decarboxylase [Fructobacillus pseudoficulneus]
MEKPLMIALDFDNLSSVTDFLDAFPDPSQLTVKVGMELFYQAGPAIIADMKKRGCQIFLDLKLFDIPNTVKQAMVQIGQLGVNYVTVHSLGGSAMLSAAKAGLAEGSAASNQPVPALLAVTELTSISDDVLKNEQHAALPMQEQVLALATMANQAGCDGVICSALELKTLRQHLQPDFLCVVPGIRMKADQSGDQVRVASPDQAAKDGASAIVVGRPITKAADPVAAWHRYQATWQNN